MGSVTWLRRDGTNHEVLLVTACIGVVLATARDDVERGGPATGEQPVRQSLLVEASDGGYSIRPYRAVRQPHSDRIARFDVTQANQRAEPIAPRVQVSSDYCCALGLTIGWRSEAVPAEDSWIRRELHLSISSHAHRPDGGVDVNRAQGDSHWWDSGWRIGSHGGLGAGAGDLNWPVGRTASPRFRR